MPFKKLKNDDKTSLKKWKEEVAALLEESSIDARDTQVEIEKRKRRLEADDEAWFAYYFEAYATAEPAPFHKRATKRLMSHNRWLEVRAWSRELAKSARSMMEVSKLALTGKIKNVLLVSNTLDNATRLLAPFMENFDKNPRIKQDYGEQKTPGSWEQEEFTCRCGTAFRALGAGQSPRGSRHKNYRPDLILIDDIDTDEECGNDDRIEKKWKWISDALLPTFSVSGNYRILVNGNIIAKDCSVTRFIEQAKKSPKIAHYEIVNIRDKNGRSSWSKNSEEDIETFFSLYSEATIQREFFNNPLSKGNIFKEMVWGECPPLHKLTFVIAYGDPSPSNSKNKATSYKACFLIGYYNGKFYVYDGRLDHVTNEEFVEWFYDMRDVVGEKTQLKCFIENNTLQDPFYQQVILPLFAKRGEEKGFISITPDTRKKPEKFDRIEGNLEPMNRQGRLILNIQEKENPHMQRLEEQFLLISRSMKAPADGPDCIEGGWWLLNENLMKLGEESVIIGKRHTNKKRY